MAETVRPGPYARFRTVLRAITIAIGAYLLGNVVAFIFLLFLAFMDIPMQGFPERQVLLGTLAVQGVGFLGFGLAYLHYADQLDLVRFDIPSLVDIGYVVAGILGVLVGWQALGFLFTQFGIEPAESALIEQGIQNPSLLLLLAPLSIILVGPAEELLYRGIVQGTIRRVLGPVGAIGIASAVFASIHASGLIGAPIEMLATLSTVFVLAVVLGSIYELSGNLLVPALVHGLFNASQFLIAYQQVTGELVS